LDKAAASGDKKAIPQTEIENCGYGSNSIINSSDDIPAFRTKLVADKLDDKVEKKGTGLIHKADGSRIRRRQVCPDHLTGQRAIPWILALWVEGAFRNPAAADANWGGEKLAKIMLS